MELEQCPFSNNGCLHNCPHNPTFKEFSNKYCSNELELMMEILDMELRADCLKWHKESEVGVGRTRGTVIRFKCCLIKFNY
jgi:hypothetical protein